MLILGIDSSGKAASVCLMKDGELLVDYTLNNERTHSEKLMEMIDSAYKISGMDISDTDAFAFTKGPGSFTGLRIGAATVKGLAEMSDKPVYSVSSLDALKESCSVYNGLPVCAMIDAGRGEVYCAVYEGEEKKLSDCCMQSESLLNYIKENYSKVLFTGDGSYKYKDIINEIFDGAVFAEKTYTVGSGSGVIRAALKTEPLSAKDAAPVYLKLSQAERMRNMNKE